MQDKAEVKKIDITSLNIEMKAIKNGSQIHISVTPFFNNMKITDILGNITDSFDILNFITSLYRDGNYFIFTCDCGEPGCGGWWDPIKVKTENNEVTWLIDNYNDTLGIFLLKYPPTYNIARRLPNL